MLRHGGRGANCKRLCSLTAGAKRKGAAASAGKFVAGNNGSGAAKSASVNQSPN